MKESEPEEKELRKHKKGHSHKKAAPLMDADSDAFDHGDQHLTKSQKKSSEPNPPKASKSDEKHRTET